MIAFSSTAATATLPKALYPRESLESGSIAVGERARVYLETKGSSWVVTVEPAKKSSRAGLVALLGALLNEALSHAQRQRVVAANRALTGPVLARALESGFPNLPPDPLEQLEPQVRADREQEIAQLMTEAQRWL